MGRHYRWQGVEEGYCGCKYGMLWDWIIALKFVTEQYNFNVISVYTPQVRLKHLKVKI